MSFDVEMNGALMALHRANDAADRAKEDVKVAFAELKRKEAACAKACENADIVKAAVLDLMTAKSGEQSLPDDFEGRFAKLQKEAAARLAKEKKCQHAGNGHHHH